MALSDITGVFSRYFVVGFFLPAYASLVSLWICASSAFIPDTFESHHSQATQLLILGGVALVVGLALSGLSYYVTRLFEGYPLERVSERPFARWLYQAAIFLQRRTYDRLLAVRDNKGKPGSDRTGAAWRLDKWFPKDPDDLLPTRVGNAIRAFEQHSNVRWGLDGVTIWPRIEALLDEDERALEVDAKINFYVFVNASVGGYLVGACLVIDQGVNAPQPVWYWPLYAIPFVVGYILYRAAIGPAIDWGDSVRSSIDLHRLEVYEKLGVRAPVSFTDERELAGKVNKALLFGYPLLPDDLWRGEQGGAEEAEGIADSGLLTRFKKCLTKGE
jgi:hypothetical protein